MWRNDKETKTSPTISSVGIRATDVRVHEGSHYDVNIRHVEGTHGKGFMAQVSHNLERALMPASKNTGVFYGTDGEAYQKCLAQGIVECETLDAKMEATTE